MLTAADHFGHRATDDIVVDGFWNRRVGDEFRVEVEGLARARSLRSLPENEDAVEAFHHPFAVARAARRDEAA